ncbi:MAG: YraN family protein [Hahellaceae bacterium]|nr:YraN family protein [Hahellaceae bacterium]MCP5169843.1 YraN family protein [Hahellaceae bacterium]
MADGSRYEALARIFLERQGLKHLSNNFRSRGGEIDLIMKDKSTLVFIEVRYRKSVKYGSAAESITAHKMKRIVNCAKYYLTINNAWAKPCRFDVVSIQPGATPENEFSINWIKSAFDAE